MKQENENNFWKNVSVVLQLFLGSTTQKLAALTKGVLKLNGDHSDLLSQHIRFDAQEYPRQEIAQLIEMNPDELMNTEEMVSSTIRKSDDSWEKLDKTGRLPYLPADFHNSGIHLEDPGAAGNHRIGITQADLNGEPLAKKINSKCQAAISHHNQTKFIFEDMDPEGLTTRLPMVLYFSTVGGTAPGAVLSLLQNGLRQSLQQQGVQPKIILHSLLPGNLPVDDRERSNINTHNILKHLQVIDSRKFRDALTGKVHRNSFDQLFLSCNQNTNGSLEDLDRLIAHEAHLNYAFWHAPAGDQIRKSLRDIEKCDYNQYGERKIGLSMSQGYIHWNRSRITRFVKNTAAGTLLSQMLQKADLDKTRQLALGLARSLHLVETEEENQVTSDLLYSEELGEMLLARAREILMDRVSAAKGTRQTIIYHFEALEDLRNELPEEFSLIMKKQAQRKCEATVTALGNHLRQLMRNIQGQSETQDHLSVWKLILEISRQAVLTEIQELQAMLQPHEENVAEAQERWQQWQNSGWFARRLMPFLPRHIAAVVKESVPVIIETLVQLSACNIALSSSLAPLIDHLDREIAKVSMLSQNLQANLDQSGNEADACRNKSSKITTPLGIELNDNPGYQEEFYQRLLQKTGGTEQVVQSLFARFLAKYDSLVDLIDKDREELRKIFLDICDEFFHPFIEECDVTSELKQVFPSRNDQDVVLDQCNKQTEGRVLITDEADEPVIWLKVAAIYGGENRDWLRSGLERVDTKPGKWENDAIFLAPFDLMHLLLVVLAACFHCLLNEEYEQKT